MIDRDGKSFERTRNPLWEGIRSFFRELLYRDVWLAGLLLGLASAVRIVAPIIGVIIFAYILVYKKWQVLPRFLAYGVIAFCFMIVFWPYLWPDPVGRLLESFSNSIDYPGVHLTLFKGVLFDSPDIPDSYLPVLLAIQLTETTLLLVFVGIFSFVKRPRWDILALVLIWFVLPVTALILGQVDLYNNFRQVFFILPPIFLIAGLGLDRLLTIIKRPVIRYAMLVLILLPALYANITLYPYQYIYYNQLVGGVGGAYRKFELDYWDLAFREAQLYVNQHASANANVFVDKSPYIMQAFARPDLVFNQFGGKNFTKYDYIIVSTAQNADKRFEKFPTVFVVSRSGVPLAYVKEAPGNNLKN
jgi:hypothetical protein